jgi:hypothetical protein
MTDMHMEKRLIHDYAVDPEHHDRDESTEFRDAKRRLKEDGHYKCYICGTTENIQVHHRGVEYMFANLANWDAVKEYLEENDIYGYGRLLRKNPITSKDDVRNQMCLCQEHHTGVDHEDGGGGTGAHSLTNSTWIMQKLAKPGCNPVPQKGETFEDAMARIAANQSHDN